MILRLLFVTARADVQITLRKDQTQSLKNSFLCEGERGEISGSLLLSFFFFQYQICLHNLRQNLTLNWVGNLSSLTVRTFLFFIYIYIYWKAFSWAPSAFSRSLITMGKDYSLKMVQMPHQDQAELKTGIQPKRAKFCVLKKQQLFGSICFSKIDLSLAQLL